MNYVAEVIGAFHARSGQTPVIDAADYARIAEWEKQEIPLFIVILAIEKAFDELDGAAAQIGSISELKDEVKRRFGAWLRSTAVERS